MPAKKTSNTAPILIKESEFLKAKEASNQRDLESHLKKLINLANHKYNETFLSKRAEHIKTFPLCKINYTKIKGIIEDQAISSSLIKIYFLEAELACIQADFNTLNCKPNSKEELNLIIENLNKIKLDFDKFNQTIIQNFKLDKKDKSKTFNQLLTYRNNFLDSWSKNSNRLLGDSHFNFAETLIKKVNEELESNRISLLEDAKNYFTQSAYFYKQAHLLKFEAQTQERLKELELILEELLDSSTTNHKNIQLKNIVLVFKKLSPTLLDKKEIEAESLWTASYKETLDKSSNEIRLTLSKRKSSDDDSNPEKKIKKEQFISSSNNELETLWIIEQKKILTKFSQLEIEIDLNKIKLKIGSIPERKAITSNNYAIFILEDLNNSEKNYSNNEKLSFLKKAEQLLNNSAELYEKANLFKKKEDIEQCRSCIRSTLTTLNVSITKLENASSTTKAHPKRAFSNEKYHFYQGGFTTRSAQAFLKSNFTKPSIHHHYEEKSSAHPKLAQTTKIR